MPPLVHVGAAYAHYPKQAVPRGLGAAPGAALKLYHIEKPGEPVPEAIARPTFFCVWELGVVAHEAAAWTRFLASPRTEADLARWRDDWLSGPV